MNEERAVRPLPLLLCEQGSPAGGRRELQRQSTSLRRRRYTHSPAPIDGGVKAVRVVEALTPIGAKCRVAAPAE